MPELPRHPGTETPDHEPDPASGRGPNRRAYAIVAVVVLVVLVMIALHLTGTVGAGTN